MNITKTNVGSLWLELLSTLEESGERAAPRGQFIRELRAVTLRLTNPLNNILAVPARKLNHRFMVAEWLWIWFGHDDVTTIEHYNPKITQFSDDGVRFRGAYGPRIKTQWPSLVELLRTDRSSRQAVLSIFQPQSGASRDVPCTLTIQFLLRDDELETIVSMRSSDVWLGLPYDVFNFTMLANTLAAELGVQLGSFTMHLGSSHLYERDVDKALVVLGDVKPWSEMFGFISSPRFAQTPPTWLDKVLTRRRQSANYVWAGVDHQVKKTVWDRYGRALLSSTRDEALEVLSEVSRG